MSRIALLHLALGSVGTADGGRFTEQGVWRYRGDPRLYVDLDENLDRHGELARAGASYQRARCVDRKDARAQQGPARIGAKSGRKP